MEDEMVAPEQPKEVQKTPFFKNWVPTSVLATEMIGVFMMTVVGMQAQITQDTSGSSYTHVVWALGLALASVISGGVSGGQLNPSVTCSLALAAKTDAFRIIPYFLSQISGGLIAASMVHMMTGDSGALASSLFAPHLKDGAGLQQAFFSSFLASSIFLVAVNAISDRRNMRIPRSYSIPYYAVSYWLVLTIFSASWEGSVIMNPAMDAGMRIVAQVHGHSAAWTQALTAYVGSIVGAIAGTLLYTLGIEYHLKDNSPPPAPVGRCQLQSQRKFAVE